MGKCGPTFFRQQNTAKVLEVFVTRQEPARQQPGGPRLWREGAGVTRSTTQIKRWRVSVVGRRGGVVWGKGFGSHLCRLGAHPVKPRHPLHQEHARAGWPPDE